MTKYSVNILNDGNWESLALFAHNCDFDAMIDFCNRQFDCGNSLYTPAEDICIVDMDTGEIAWLWSDDHPEWDDEPADIDSDCGFDPYLGCFTDDC